MKKLLLACTIVASAGFLHGMEVQQKPSVAHGAMADKQVAPITWLQTYHHFSEILNQDVAQEIFGKLFEVQDIDFSQLNINEYFSAQEHLTKLIDAFDCDFVIEIVDIFLNQAKISICDIKDKEHCNETLLHRAMYDPSPKFTQLIIKLAGDNIWTLLSAQDDRVKSTPLHMAALWHRAQTVELLLKAAGKEARTLLEFQDCNNETPLDIAKKYPSKSELDSEKRCIDALTQDIKKIGDQDAAFFKMFRLEVFNPEHYYNTLKKKQDNQEGTLKLLEDAYAACNEVEDEKNEVEAPKDTRFSYKTFLAVGLVSLLVGLYR